MRWKDRVKEYMHERGADVGGGLQQARRERWILFFHGHSPGDTCGGNEASEILDK